MASGTEHTTNDDSEAAALAKQDANLIDDYFNVREVDDVEKRVREMKD